MFTAQKCNDSVMIGVGLEWMVVQEFFDGSEKVIGYFAESDDADMVAEHLSERSTVQLMYEDFGPAASNG